MTGKRSEGKEAEDFQGGGYEAAVHQEKQDGELVDGGLSGAGDCGSEREEVNVAALNVRTRTHMSWSNILVVH